MPPATGHAILADIKDVFKFVSEDLNRHLEKRQGAIRVNGDATMLENSGADTTTLNHVPTFHVDSGALAVAGTSAGGLCAYLAAVHASPKPKAVASLYAMGGKFLTAHYLTPKTKPFLRGREILDPNLFSQYLYPFNGLLPTSDSPLSYHPPTSPTPGYPANDRMLIGRLQLQLGVVLDYYTGEHEPSLSAFLRERLASLLDNSTPPAQSDDLQSLIPAKHIEIFPEFNVSSDWPPTCLVHGTKDTAVPPQESLHMYGLLKKAGVEVTMMNVEGKEHSFDYEPNADVIHEREFDMIVEFLHRQLDKGREIVV
ncbi:hypothetical protein SERLADRAFT_470927 [Serpula lacrymans var. lacrymans S7.9]|nr:uncharacterized protein SERLADRAFT_470927 [Serpula lacrymans var. lacrymans S7.9]EGO24137.1 hypothetical protein SERLADRAFT_470927 [Serpula lacrymans var. lacrymans S7.9]